LTGCTEPENPASDLMSAFPSFASSSDAPTTAMDRGLNKRASGARAGTTAVYGGIRHFIDVPILLRGRSPRSVRPMRYPDVAIPLGATWSSPFARWQGSLANLSSLDLATQVTRDALDRASLPVEAITDLVLGMTVPQRESFYGAPTLAARLGAPAITGPSITQACATSVACIHAAASAMDDHAVTLVVTTDRLSNSPLVIYPAPSTQGGTPEVERWSLDNFARDPWAGESMTATAEAVAAEEGITRGELDDVTARRYEQYAEALTDDRSFQRAWMVPAVIPSRRGEPVVVDEDEGITATTAESLTALRPATADGVVTFGTQTHPADGTAGMVLTTVARAKELSGGRGVARVLSSGFARVEPARMPRAPVPAARAALDAAGLDIGDLDVVKTHNPFTVNDVYFARETGFPVHEMNPFGSSLVYGHPQGPTGARGITELLECLVRRGGGVGLFTGCAAGDSGAALVLRVE
jgi:acetyl-CoA acetyltransferase family protein